jgi:hypothetical protein
LFQLAAALTLPFILSKAITLGAPAFLTAVAEDSSQIRIAVLLSVIGSALTVSLGIVAYPQFQHYSRSAAQLFLVVCAVSCTLDLVQGGTIMSMLALSDQFVTSGTKDSVAYNIIGAAIASIRRSAHVTQLFAIAGWMFVFYITLLRYKLIPRTLALLGIIGVSLQFTGVTLMMFLGFPSIGQMAMPLLPIHLTVAVWLIVKGFNNSRHMLSVTRT